MNDIEGTANDIVCTARFQFLAQAVDEEIITAQEAVKLYNNPEFHAGDFEGKVNEKELSDYFWDFLSGTGEVLWSMAQSALAEWLLVGLMGVSGKPIAKLIKKIRRAII